MGTTGEAVSLQKMAGKLKKTSLKLVKQSQLLEHGKYCNTKVGNYYCKHVHQYVDQDFWRVKPTPMRNLHSAHWICKALGSIRGLNFGGSLSRGRETHVAIQE